MLKWVMTIAVCTTLAACSNTPDGTEDARSIANSDAMIQSIFKVEDFVRENGWYDGVNYKVRFNFNLVPQGDNHYMWAEMIKHFLVGNIKGASELVPGKSPDELKQLLQLSSIEMAMIRGFSKRLRETVLQWPEASEAFRVHGPTLMKDEFLVSFVLGNVFDTLTDKGYTADVKAGDKIPRTITLTYVKTEKGWIKSQ